MTVRLAVFDCDGTLSDGQAAICAAMAEGFAEAGLAAPDPHQVRRIVGLSLPSAVARLAPDETPEMHARAVAAYKQAFFRARERGLVQEPLFDGVAALLTRLHRTGWTLGVATGKSDRGLKHCLEQHDIHARFVSLQTADRHPSKPHPSMVEKAIDDAGGSASSTIVVGDTSFDMAMAANAGATGIGAAWGYHEAEDLLDAGAVAVAHQPGEVVDLIREHVDG